MSVNTFRIERAPHGTEHTPHNTTTPGTGTHHPALTTTVPKEFVHRAGVAEVMLTGWHRKSENHFGMTAQWPRGHSFFTHVAGHHDPLIAAETIRQAGALLAHAEYGVPLGHHFLMSDLSLATHPAHLLAGSTPASLDIDITCREVKKRRDTLTGLRYDTVIRRDGHTAATGSAAFTCTSPTVYRRLRAGRLHNNHPTLPLTAPTAPQNVGRTSPTDVVLSPTTNPHRWQLRVDTRHPVLFEHPVDHIPGMMLLEAARQATTATLGYTTPPLTITGQFTRYAELDTPCHIETHHTPTPTHTHPHHDTVHITAHQNNQPLFHSTITTTPPTT
ncbi:ScbA/BarX family gamma-butyrolactone biosynthesis protein [Streptomyces sp. NPDC102274]|uniref:ScbA/BarX family gamma-butyrolactone biosynthesis protein n=1 Tax=Streptomyces sp. NPDC102274 TaxID=3366151 RepID=UPI00381F0EEC